MDKANPAFSLYTFALAIYPAAGIILQQKVWLVMGLGIGLGLGLAYFGYLCDDRWTPKLSL